MLPWLAAETLQRIRKTERDQCLRLLCLFALEVGDAGCVLVFDDGELSRLLGLEGGGNRCWLDEERRTARRAPAGAGGDDAGAARPPEL